MKTIDQKAVAVLSCFLLLANGSLLQAQSVELVQAEGGLAMQQPAISVSEAQVKQNVADPLPVNFEDTLTFLNSTPTLSASDSSPMEIPEGWTRTASNANYAFKTEMDPYSSRIEYLFVMDLRTGVATNVASANPRGGDRGFSFVDVTNNSIAGGAVAVFEKINPYAGRSEIHVRRVSDPAQEYSFTIQLDDYAGSYSDFENGIVSGITISENIMSIDREDGRQTLIDLVDLSLSTPNGWTRAASNPNFAFRTRFMGTVSLRNYILELKNLATGGETQIDSRGDYYTSADYPIYDISSDGRYVIYGLKKDHSGPDRQYSEASTLIKDLWGPARSLTLNGVATSIRFASDTEAVTEINGVEVRIDLQNMQAFDPFDISTPTTAALTDFNTYGITPLPISAFGQEGMVLNFRQDSSEQFAFDYDLRPGIATGQGWVAVMFLFNGYHAFDVTATDIVLETNMTGTSYYKLELEDQQGLKTVFRVTVTNGRIQVTNAMIQSIAPAGFGSNRLKAIIMTIDDPQATTGSVTVKTKGLIYQPVIDGSAYNLAAVTQLPGNPILNSGHGSVYGADNGTIQTTQTSASELAFSYTLPESNDFAFAYLSDGFFNDRGVFQGNPMNLTSGVTLAMKGPAGKQIKVEFKDTSGHVGVAYLNLTGQLQNYTLLLSELGVDPESIGQIAFVAEQKKTGSSGLVQVELKGMNYVPVISAATTAPLTDFSMNAPNAIPIGGIGDGALRSFQQLGSSQFNFGYDFAVAERDRRWAAAMLLFDNEHSFNAGANDLVLEANVTGANYYKLELEDRAGLKTVFRVTVTNGRIRVTKPMTESAMPAGFDMSRLKGIVIVVDDPQVTSGSVTVTSAAVVQLKPIQTSSVIPDLKLLPVSGLRNIALLNPSLRGSLAQIFPRSFELTSKTGKSSSFTSSIPSLEELYRKKYLPEYLKYLG